MSTAKNDLSIHLKTPETFSYVFEILRTQFSAPNSYLSGRQGIGKKHLIKITERL